MKPDMGSPKQIRLIVPALVTADSVHVEEQEALADADIKAGRVEGFSSADEMMKSLWAHWRTQHAQVSEPALGESSSE